MPLPHTASVPSGSPGAKQVLDAARELFGELGIDAVSMQDIATRAGVSKANVFHHFENKEALYLAVLKAAVPHDGAAIAALIASDAPFEDRLLALMQNQLKDMHDDPRSTRLVIREVTTGNAERARLIATQLFAEKIRSRLAFFENARDRGELRPGIEPYLCDMLLGACCMFQFNCGAVSKHISDEIGTVMPDCHAAYAKAVCDVLTHGLCPPRTVAAPRARKPAASRRKPLRRKPSLQR